MPFAFWLMQEIRPKIFVELGTHSANSYFSFCQAVRDRRLMSRCYAVDTWKGDEHAGFYGGEVFEMVNRHNESQYKSFSRLCRMTFDDALGLFQDRSVDLLHIDGFHGYEAVRHDFEAWLPKLAPGALVLFHDITVAHEGFGVHKLWAELKQKYLENFEFSNGGGLGVMRVPIANSTQDGELAWLYEGTKERKRLFEVMSANGESLITKIRVQKLERLVSILKANTGQPTAERLVNVELFFAQEGQTFSKEQKISKPTLYFGSECIRFRILLNGKATQSDLWRIDPGNQIGEIKLIELKFLDQKGRVLWSLEDHREQIIVRGTAVQLPHPKVGIEVLSTGGDPIIHLPRLPQNILPISCVHLDLRHASLSKDMTAFIQVQNEELEHLQMCLDGKDAQAVQLKSTLMREEQQMQKVGLMDKKIENIRQKMEADWECAKRVGKKLEEVRSRLENHRKDLQKKIGQVQHEMNSKLSVILADLDKRNTKVRRKIQNELGLVQNLISEKLKEVNPVKQVNEGMMCDLGNIPLKDKKI